MLQTFLTVLRLISNVHSHPAFIHLGLRRAAKITDQKHGFSYVIVQTHESHDQIPQTGTVIHITINNETIGESWLYGRYTGAGTNYFRGFTLLCLFRIYKNVQQNKRISFFV